jgi:hypothetical protein
VEGSDGNSVGVCILPKATEEGIEVALKDRQFALQVNQPVQFMLSSYNGDETFSAGQIVEMSEAIAEPAEDGRFQKLPPLVAALDHNDVQKEVAVTLVTHLTEVGTLDLYCQSQSDERRWKVEFQLRKTLQSMHGHQGGALPPRTEDAIAEIEVVFGASDKNADVQVVKRLRPSLEKLLGDRSEWDTALSRALFDALWERRRKRRRSQNHERIWFNLAGFCIRPGFGYPADDWRVDNIWSLYQQGLQFNKENQSWADWWTFWRRLAGGLDQTAQLRIYKDISKFLNPASTRNQKLKTESKNKSYDDMVR